MMNHEELQEAKRQLAMLIENGGASSLSKADRDLLKKYPRHTLAAARLIDATTCPRAPLNDHVIHDAGQDFQYLQWQESGTPYTRQ
jgi:hypothetical protein